MHALLLEEIVALCKLRMSQGDCPTEPAAPIELLEHAIVQLSSYVCALAAGKGAPPEALTNERAEFEAWFLDYCGTGPQDAVFDQASVGWIKRRDDGEYEETRVRDCWTVWQGCASRAAIRALAARSLPPSGGDEK